MIHLNTDWYERAQSKIQNPKSKIQNPKFTEGAIMPTFEQAIEIQAEPAELFDLTQDYSRRLEWAPFLKVAQLHGDAPGVGVRAWCVAWNGLGMETEYVTF